MGRGLYGVFQKSLGTNCMVEIFNMILYDDKENYQCMILIHGLRLNYPTIMMDSPVQ